MVQFQPFLGYIYSIWKYLFSIYTFVSLYTFRVKFFGYFFLNFEIETLKQDFFSV